MRKTLPAQAAQVKMRGETVTLGEAGTRTGIGLPVNGSLTGGIEVHRADQEHMRLR
jgi:hypothetical protein